MGFSLGAGRGYVGIHQLLVHTRLTVSLHAINPATSVVDYTAELIKPRAIGAGKGDLTDEYRNAIGNASHKSTWRTTMRTASLSPSLFAPPTWKKHQWRHYVRRNSLRKGRESFPDILKERHYGIGDTRLHPAEGMDGETVTRGMDG